MTLMLSSNEVDIWKFLYPEKYSGPCINISISIQTKQVKHVLIMHVPVQKSNIPFIGEGPNTINRNTRIFWKEGNKGVSCRLPAIRAINKKYGSLKLPWNETQKWVQNDVKNSLLEFLALIYCGRHWTQEKSFGPLEEVFNYRHNVTVLSWAFDVSVMGKGFHVTTLLNPDEIRRRCRGYDQSSKSIH